MASAPLDAVLSHWSTLLEGFSVAPLDFYASVEQAMQQRQIPNISTSQVEWDETGPFSAKRVYLRVTRGHHVFDICAAPFGNGFFVSSWLAQGELVGGLAAFVLLTLLVPVALFLSLKIFGLVFGSFVFFVVLPLGFWIVAQIMTARQPGWDDPLVAMPLLGRFYERFFRPDTYYSIDTALMFQKAVHNSVLDVIDQLTRQNGIRQLTEVERKPILHGLLRS